MISHTSPLTSVQFEDYIRVYFSTRGAKDSKGNYCAKVGYVDLGNTEPHSLVSMVTEPLLPLGHPGTFDEHGSMVAEVIRHQGQYWMYYMGWQRSDTVPYTIRLGLATSDDGCSFTKISDGPIMGMCLGAPYGVGNVSVMEDCGVLRMWYTRYKPWIRTEMGYRPDYDLHYAESINGIEWSHKGVCLPAANGESLATPCVRKINGQYYMWYSVRPDVTAAGGSGKYRIGYAESDDGMAWTRMDHVVGIDPSAEGWDSEMVCYPDVLLRGDALIMLYCGNGYGATGFGAARLRVSELCGYCDNAPIE